MGIDGFIEWEPDTNWRPIDPEVWKILQEIGLDVPLEKIDIPADGTLEYQGLKVVVYIRDQIYYHRYSIDDPSDSEYKFHIAWCETLREMKKRRRYNTRYVVSRRMDGKFTVNRILNNQMVDKDLELRMKVCKYCLGRINYKGYRNNREKIFSEFSIKEYFEKYDTYITTLPPHTANTAPLNIYSTNWSYISQKSRELQRWICEECGRDFSNRKNFLQTHHIDGDKSHHWPENLKVLC